MVTIWKLLIHICIGDSTGVPFPRFLAAPPRRPRPAGEPRPVVTLLGSPRHALDWEADGEDSSCFDEWFDDDEYNYTIEY
jgi:hypothetical protein